MSGSCRDEHDGHGHGNHHEHEHEHDHDGPERGFELSLYRQVASERITCLNEKVEGSAKLVFKNWENKESRTEYVESDVDEQLIIHVPFNAMVKLKGIEIRGPENGNGPSKLKVWINRSDIDFDMAERLPAIQEWDLVEFPPGNGIVEYPTRIHECDLRMARFNNVRSITLFFPDNFTGDECTRIDYIGFKGEWEEFKEEPIVSVFELNANPADHPKAKEQIGAGNMIQ